MGKTKVTIETTDDVPADVLVEHVRWAVEELTKETGEATVTLDSPNPRSHPFEGGVEVFDDYTNGPATGGWVLGAAHEGSFAKVTAGEVIISADDRTLIARAVQALRDKKFGPQRGV